MVVSVVVVEVSDTVVVVMVVVVVSVNVVVVDVMLVVVTVVVIGSFFGTTHSSYPGEHTASAYLMPRFASAVVFWHASTFPTIVG